MIKRIFTYSLLSVLFFSCKKNESIVDCYSGTTIMDTAVLLVLGQSNAANFGETKYTASCSRALNFYNGDLSHLSDPLKGANGDGGSPWSRLADILLQQRFAKTVIIAPAAVGGTSVEHWKPGGSLNHLITGTIAALQSKGLTITHVLWHQGEADHTLLNPYMTATENAQQYRVDFLELAGQLRSLNVHAPIFVSVATICGTSADIELQNVQRDIPNDSLNIFHGPNTDMLGSPYRQEECHFNDDGLMVHALLWSDILLSH